MIKEEYVEDLMQNNKHFCLAPWVHLHITGLGNMAPCMQLYEGPETMGYGNLNKQAFETLWQGKKIRQFRLRLLTGKANVNCMKCYQNEKIGYWSLRKQILRQFSDYKQWIIETDEEGYSLNAKPIFWDLRFSNLCNLKCRMCFYSASSFWFHDAKALGDLTANQTESIINGVEDTKKLMESLDEYIPHLKKILFAGGEPLLLEENYYIINKLIESKNLLVDIKYNTNLTKFGFRDQDLLNLWRNFENISVYVSLDAIGERCEYIRKNCKWELLIQNIKKINKISTIEVNINVTVSIFNILSITKLHHFLVEEGLIDVTHICLNLLHGPLYYSIQILPKSMKSYVENEIKEHTKWIENHPTFILDNNGYYANTLEQWKMCIDFMNEKDGTRFIAEFIEITDRVDSLRNESLLENFPELKPVYEYRYEEA